jgi:hypothetical protein
MAVMLRPGSRERLRNIPDGYLIGFRLGMCRGFPNKERNADESDGCQHV